MEIHYNPEYIQIYNKQTKVKAPIELKNVWEILIFIAKINKLP